jgi:hypothetical protein
LPKKETSMDELLQKALQEFQSLSIEKQRDILWKYVLYVETVLVEELGDPFLFLEWYLKGEPDA